ncbi:MAG: EAL domain-containing protein [Eubacteriales bacterium]|nr:EAL domain-containing protein [Eubacteriales bacterium]
MIPKKKILIVEDNALNRAMLSEILADEYQVLEAENGRAALDVLSQYGDSIALILLDVMMPVMDGYTFLDHVKKEDKLALIPVIVMTQSDSEDDEVSALAHGATDFVPKPYRPQVILHRVASIIKLRETAAMVNQFQYDRLTGLYSKEFFYQKMRETLQNDLEQEYTIICFNVENFKLYNDTFGVKAGDRLLQEIAASLREQIGQKGICCRYSADRFLCLKERKQEQEDRKRFFGSIFLENDGNRGSVSAKWGIYEVTDRSIPVEQMCDRALLVVDSIKGQYNQHFAVYDDALRGKLLREKNITDAMEIALAEEQFIVYFQPKYNLNENTMAGAEALVRWIHPEWGFMSPGDFIPLFEKNGFITRLDQYVWEHVCAQLRSWKEKGYPLLPVSVNVSRLDIYQMNLAELILGIVQKYGIDPEYLHLEITESAYAENPGKIIKTVDELRNLGFIIEMDDFGSGYSSLNMLNQMNLDILKLDMKFIQNEMEKPAEQSILRFIVNLAHWMNLSVVAEGVETREQMERLREMECDYVQGYYFAKPMPIEEYEELLESQSSQFVVQPMKVSQKETSMRSLLVVDEDDKYRAKVCNTFEGHYRVLEVSDAQSALARIMEYGCDAVSAIILSMTIPENGADSLLKILRQNPRFWHIPVLATVQGGEIMEKTSLAWETDDFLCKCHPQRDLYKRVSRLIRIAASHERESTLRDEASRDYLTGLLNRRGLQIAMESLRKEDLPLAVCLFDLDDLKKVNDNFGHDVGDRILRQFADLLRRKTRSEDILCRYGGDEFVVILRRFGDKAAVLKKGEELCRAFREYFEEENFCAACSGGIALCGVDEKTSVKLIECADQALYCAKRENKGHCCLWNGDKDSIE